jgi:hypothetical protein
MKLYATISTERATKGQGGNKYLNIELFAGDAKHPVRVAYISLDKIDKGYGLTFLPIKEDGKSIFISDELIAEKAKKIQPQKCYCEDSGLSIPHLDIDHQNGKQFECFHDKPCLNCETEKGKRQKAEVCEQCGNPAIKRETLCRHCLGIE